MHSSSDNPQVVVVIVNYNSWDELASLTNALSHNKYPRFAVVIVDNHSPTKKPKDFPKEGWDIMFMNQQNVGYGQGCNIGAKIGDENYPSPDYYLFMNPDMLPGNHFIEDMVSAAGDGDRISKFINHPHPANIIAPALIRPDGTKIQRLDYLGGCFMITGETFRELKGFDPAYFLFSEDRDLQQRAGEMGVGVKYCPGIKVTHKSSTSVGGNKSPVSVYNGTRSSIIYARRYFKPWGFRVFIVKLILETAYKIPQPGLLLHYIHGIQDGYRETLTHNPVKP